MKIGFVSDIHEDIERLVLAIDLLKTNGVDEIVCLGDMVGYSVPYYGYLKTRNANAVLDLVRRECTDVLIGNHDLYALRKVPTHNGFFNYPDSWYNLDYVDRLRISEGKIFLYEDNELSSLLTQDSKNYLLSLPEFVIKNVDGKKILLSHYAYPDLTGSAKFEFRHPSHIHNHLKFMESVGCVRSFSGNDHWNGCQIIDGLCVREVEFSRGAELKQLSWVHGPAIARGTTKSGVMIYDSEKDTITPIEINADLHIIPDSI